MFVALALIVSAYLLGSVSSAMLVCRLFKLGDPRTRGSNNPGTTNMLRLHGKKAAVLTLIGDVMKGVVAVMIGYWLHASGAVLAAVGMAVFCGHLFPVFFDFKGGKGVATLIGVLLGICWLVGLAFIGTWLLVAAVSRYSSLAALTAAAMTPVYTALLMPLFARPPVDIAWLTAGAVVMAALLFWRHTANIRKLLHGEERRIGSG